MPMIKCPECGKDVSDLAEKCPNCGFPVNSTGNKTTNYNQGSYVQPVVVTPYQEKQKQSTLGIVALILSIIGCTFWLGIILAIIDLCKKDNKKKTCSIIGLVIGCIWLLLIVFASASSDDNEPKKVETTVTQDISEEPEQAIEEEPEEDTEDEVALDETTFKQGETAELNGVRVTMTSYEESNGGDYNKPSDGNVFVIAEFEIENNTDGELNISSMLSFEAYADDYSLNYSIGALMAKQDANQLDGTIAAGKKMKGVIGYEVPSDWHNIEIHFTDDVWSNNKFIFEIDK